MTCLKNKIVESLTTKSELHLVHSCVKDTATVSSNLSGKALQIRALTPNLTEGVTVSLSKHSQIQSLHMQLFPGDKARVKIDSDCSIKNMVLETIDLPKSHAQVSHEAFVSFVGGKKPNSIKCISSNTLLQKKI